MTVARSADGRRHSLYGEELGGADRISLNLYLLSDDRPVLKPCEMPEAKVVDFVLRYEPDGRIGGAPRPAEGRGADGS